MKNGFWKLHRDRGLGGLGASGAPAVIKYRPDASCMSYMEACTESLESIIISRGAWSTETTETAVSV